MRALDVLVIHPPWFRLMGSTLVQYPGGIASIAAVLERIGLRVAAWNTDFEVGKKIMIGGTNIARTSELAGAQRGYLENLRDPGHAAWGEVKRRLAELRPRVVGVSVFSCSYESALNVARISKQVLPEAPVVFGGIHPTVAPQDVMSHPEVDVAVLGEGEDTAVELFPRLLGGARPEDLVGMKGIAVRAGGQVVVGERRPPILDLDSLPLPGRHLLLDVDRMPGTAHQPIFGSRGCPYHCVFCGSHNVFGRKPRFRDGEAMADEIDYVHRRFGTRYFYICDDDFFYKRERVLAFCERLRRRRTRIYFSMQSRGEKVDEALLEAVRSVGGQHVAIGVETGDPEIRKHIKKANSLEDVRHAARLIRKHRLRMVGFFMIGFPWETEEQIDRTTEFMEELNPVLAFPYIVTPAPGTELAQIALNMGLIPTDANFSEFYHESPTMALSAEIPRERHRGIIDRTLERYSAHNKRSLRRDLFTRPRFWWHYLLDSGLQATPRALFEHARDLV